MIDPHLDHMRRQRSHHTREVVTGDLSRVAALEERIAALERALTDAVSKLSDDMAAALRGTLSQVDRVEGTLKQISTLLPKAAA